MEKEDNELDLTLRKGRMITEVLNLRLLRKEEKAIEISSQILEIGSSMDSAMVRMINGMERKDIIQFLDPRQPDDPRLMD